MELSNQNILFVSRSTQHAGTENVIMQLCEIFHSLVNKIVVVSASGFSIDKLKPYRIKHYTIPDIENKSLKTIVTISSTLKNVVKEEKISVIHTHHRMAAFYVRLLGLDKRCFFINTSHNTFFNKKMLTRFAYKNCNLIACGEMVKKNLVNVFELINVTVIHNAVKEFDGQVVSESDFEEARKNDQFLIGNVGRLTEQKGMKYYIKAIPKVMEKHPEARFYIIGDGEDRVELEELCNKLKVNLTFMGFRRDVRNLMSQLDFIVLSSLWEGLPLTPIEAFSVGKTVVATGVDGTLEVVRNKENGLLVKARDAKSLAEKINWMIEHPEERKQMEQKAKETFENEFSFKILTQSYIDYYRSL